MFGRGFLWETNAGGGSSPHSKKKGQTTTEHAVAVTLALAVVAGLVVFVGAMRDNINAAGNGVADTFAALAGEGGTGGGAGGGESDEPVPDPNGVAFAVYSEDDNSLDFYKRDRLPEVGTKFNGKTVTEVYEGIESSNYYNDGTYDNKQAAPWNKKGLARRYKSSTVVDKSIQPKSLSYWFSGMSNLENCEITNLDLSKTTSLASTFGGCSSLSSLDISSWNTKHVTSMDGTFSSCESLKSITGIEDLDVSSCESMQRTFSYCRALTTLDLSSWNTASLATLTNTFERCSSLTQIKGIDNFNTSHAKRIDRVFYDCPSLQYLDLSNWVNKGKSWSSYTTGGNYFVGCSSLQWIAVGSSWEWEPDWGAMGSNTYLDSSAFDQEGAWYALSDGTAYQPNKIPSRKADTYYASKSLRDAAAAEAGL